MSFDPLLSSFPQTFIRAKTISPAVWFISRAICSNAFVSMIIHSVLNTIPNTHIFIRRLNIIRARKKFISFNLRNWENSARLQRIAVKIPATWRFVDFNFRAIETHFYLRLHLTNFNWQILWHFARSERLRSLDICKCFAQIANGWSKRKYSIPSTSSLEKVSKL